MTTSADADATANPTSAGLPDFFIVGSAKSGTTALYSMLRRHPQIFMPDSKEPWFFASELHEGTPPRPEGTPRTLEEYRAWFDGARPGQRVGEGSVLYLWSRTAAAAIAAACPDARIIAILREPAELLRSLHLQFVETYIETELDFRKALELEAERREGRCLPRNAYWPRALLYSDHVRYVEQLRRFDDVFPSDQMLVLIYDDFRDDNEGTVRQVLRFLDVSDDIALEPMRVNPTVHVRSQRVHEFLRAVAAPNGRAATAAKSAVKALTPATLRRRILEATKQRLVYGEAKPADEALMAELRERFAGEVAALSDYLDRDLITLWGYGGVG
jgi:Sulfotransferase domain